MKKYPDDSGITSFTVDTPASNRYSVFSGISNRAVYRRPIPHATIIHLANILQPIGDPKEEDLANNQIFGFKYNDWLHQNEQMFPIMNMKGMKNSFGEHIKSNWNEKKKEFTFSVRKKASQPQINAVLGFIKMNLPSLSRVDVKIKRGKKYDTIKGINTIGELESSIHHEIRRRARIYYKLRW